MDFPQEVIIGLTAFRGVVAVNLYLVYVVDTICFVHLENAIDNLFGQILVRFVHTILGDVDGGDHLDSVWQSV